MEAKLSLAQWGCRWHTQNDAAVRKLRARRRRQNKCSGRSDKPSNLALSLQCEVTHHNQTVSWHRWEGRPGRRRVLAYDLCRRSRTPIESRVDAHPADQSEVFEQLVHAALHALHIVVVKAARLMWRARSRPWHDLV